MKGEVLHYDDNAGIGQISGADGIRYNFTRADLKQLVPISKGSKVDFDFEGKDARDIYLDGPVTPAGATVYAAAPEAYSGPVEPELSMFGYFNRTLSQNYFNFKGRARRKEYWGFTVFYIVAYLVLFVILAIGIGANPENPQESPAFWVGAALLTIFTLASIIPQLALLTRRAHDIGLSGWVVVALVVLGLVPYLGTVTGIAALVIACIDSQRFVNKYGPPPKTW